MTSGLYTDGSIQVRAFTDDNFSESTPMESMILPYNSLITSAQLDGVNYRVVGIGQIGAVITIILGDGSQLTTVVDEYGDFEIMISLFAEQPFLISMSNELLSTSQQTITLPPIYPSSQAYNIFDQINLQMITRSLTDPGDEVILVSLSSEQVIMLDINGIKQITYPYTGELLFLLVNGVNTGYIPEPRFLIVNFPRSYVTDSGDPVTVEIDLSKVDPYITGIITNFTLNQGSTYNIYGDTPLILDYDTSGIVPDANYLLTITASDTNETRYNNRIMYTMGSKTPRNVFINWTADGNLTGIYITDLDSVGPSNTLSIEVISLVTPQGTINVGAVMPPISIQLDYDFINRLASVIDLTAINTFIQSSIQDNISADQIVVTMILSIMISTNGSAIPTSDKILTGLYILGS